MAFQLDSPHHVGKQVRRAAVRQLNKALRTLRRRARVKGAEDKAVHSLRKRLKKVRALLRLVREDLGEKVFARDDHALRDAARPFSQVRDAVALIETVKSLQELQAGKVLRQTFKPVQSALRLRRIRIRRDVLKRGDAFRTGASEMKKIHERVARWRLGHGTWKMLQSGLRETYKRSRNAMKAALKSGSDEQWHECRKRAKDLQYQLELMQPLWPDMMKTIGEQAHQLTTLLGDDHDLAVLERFLDKSRSTISVPNAKLLQVLMKSRREDLQASAGSLGEKLFAESPAQFAARIHTYWKISAERSSV